MLKIIRLKKSIVLQRLYHSGVATFNQQHFKDNSDKIAINDNLGEHSYKDLNVCSNKIASALSSLLPKRSESKDNSNVAFLTPNNHQYSIAQLGIWKSGLSCVPLCKSHPPETLKYYIDDSKSSALIVTKDYLEKVTL